MLLGFWLGRFQLSGRGVTTTGSMFWRKKGNGSYVVCWRNKRVTQSKWFHGILTKLVGIGERGCQTHIFPSDTTHYNLKKIFSQTSRSHFNHRSRVLSAIFFILMLFALKEDLCGEDEFCCWPVSFLLTIDLLSKYLGTRVFDWPRGNFHLAQLPLYRERSGKLEFFQRQRLKTWGRQLKTYPSRTVSVGGFRKNFCTLFDWSPVLFFSTFPTGRGWLCCGESPSKGRRDLALGFHASFEILLNNESMRLWFLLW